MNSAKSNILILGGDVQLILSLALIGKLELAKAGDTLESFQILTDYKNAGDLRDVDYFNHF